MNTLYIICLRVYIAVLLVVSARSKHHREGPLPIMGLTLETSNQTVRSQCSENKLKQLLRGTICPSYRTDIGTYTYVHIHTRTNGRRNRTDKEVCCGRSDSVLPRTQQVNLNNKDDSSKELTELIATMTDTLTQRDNGRTCGQNLLSR